MSNFLKSTRLLIPMILILMSVIIPSSIISGAQEKEVREKICLKVTILLFSGRPDPTYLLEDKDLIEHLKTLIATAKINEKFEKTTVIPSILGYKGIFVDNPTQIAGLPAHFAVYKGNVEIKNEGKKFLIDEGGVIENLLLQQAIEKGVIPKEVVKRIKISPVK